MIIKIVGQKSYLTEIIEIKRLQTFFDPLKSLT